MDNKIKIMIVDDHKMVRSGIRLIIEHETDMVVVAELGSGEEAIDTFKLSRPDIILMDISLTGMNGILATEKLMNIDSKLKIIALTMHSEDKYLESFIKAGGVGYIHKASADRDLINFLRAVDKGEYALQKEGVKVLVEKYKESFNEYSPIKSLSEREYEVFELTARGYTSREIGEKLFLSPRTIETYRTRIMAKLEIKHRSELLDFAIRANII